MNWLSRQVSVQAVSALAFVFFAVAMAIIAVSPPNFLYDEVYYHGYAIELSEKGFGLTYLRELIAPTGPLYAFVHQILAWMTDLRILPMRVATNVMFASAAMAIAILLSMVRAQNASSVPALIYGIPYAGVTFGLALTEVPAMLAASVATLALVKGLLLIDDRCEASRPSGASRQIAAYALCILAGLLYAGAVWGRQNYLVAIFALPVMFFFSRGFALLPWMVVTGILGSLSALLFLIWGGLVPEAVRYVSTDPRDGLGHGIVAGLNIAYGITALGYAAVLFCILSPRVFVARTGVIAVSAVLSAAAFTLLENLRFMPSKFLLERLIGPAATEFLGVVLGIPFTFLGLWLLLSVLLRCYETVAGREAQPEAHASYGSWSKHPVLRGLLALEMKDRLYVFASFAWLLILASNMKILHQFSSRYVVVAAPFLLITAARHFEPTRGAVLRLVGGFTVSMIFLANYYRWL